ncbi:MAG TPA: amino acid adenylation domain-containing protein [Bacteroidota bacterium]|nr:amino acid adenylation domain-containing protein [Bacteroidota bacterium]
MESPTLAGPEDLLNDHARGRDPGAEAAAVPSFAQQRLWFLDRLERGSAAYNIPRLYRIRGTLDAACLDRCVTEIVRRHRILRSVIAGEAEPVLTEVERIPGVFRVEDVAGTDGKGREESGRRRAEEEAQRPFDLAAGPLLRVLQLRLGEDDHYLLIVLHHIVADGWSMGVFVRELGELYEAFSTGRESPLAELPLQYAEFAAWQRGRLQGEFLAEQLRYWRSELGGALPVLDLPTDHLRPGARRSLGATYRFVIRGDVIEALKALSRREGCTLFMTLLAAYGTLLHRYTDQEEVIVGSPIAGRTRVDAEPLIGLFVNTLTIRIDCSGSPAFRELLRRVRARALAAYEHQEVPFEKIVEELQPERSLSRTPLFQTLFVLQNTPAPVLRIPGARATKEEIDTATAKFDLTFSVTETGDQSEGLVEYDTDLFERATIVRLAQHFNGLLEDVLRRPDASIAEYPLLTPVERQRILTEWNRPELPAGSAMRLHDLFEAFSGREPDRTALVAGADRISYGELNARANRLARVLQARGVQSESLVAVCMERSADLIAALLAVSKAGGAFVALDPAYPDERNSWLVRDAGAALVLTQAHLRQRFPFLQGAGGAAVLDVEEVIRSGEPAENPHCPATPAGLAYVIYTSGSTGRPKGVAIEHRNAGVLIAWARDVYDAEELDGVCASTSVCFDLSIFEIFVPLSLGGKIILAENALQVPALPAAREIRLLNTVPSAMNELLRIDGVPPSVRTVNLAGEPLTQALVRKVYGLGSVRKVYDLYGPSEDTTYSTFALRTPDGPQTIGRPLTGKQVYVLDAHRMLVPVGVRGEICIGGGGVARGYLGRTELTNERFVPDPFAGGRLYRTGDVGRLMPDGMIEFLGRMDNQVKLRGYRIEPGEVESTLVAMPGVREAAVIVREDVAGFRRLVAYVVPAGTAGAAGTDIRANLRTKLPEYMVPSAVVLLRALPLLPNGKVDRSALPVPEAATDIGGAASADAPRTEVERIIAGIWKSMLGGKEIGVHDNFFDLGGHSLLATQVISRMREALHVSLPLVALFESPTVESLAAVVERSAGPQP